MKRFLRLTSVLIFAFLIPNASQAIVQPPAGCERDPDRNVVCTSQCLYGAAGASCETKSYTAPNWYCWQELLLHTCFDGQDDPCCGYTGGF